MDQEQRKIEQLVIDYVSAFKESHKKSLEAFEELKNYSLKLQEKYGLSQSSIGETKKPAEERNLIVGFQSKAQEYQDKFLNEILFVFKENPDSKFTGKDISDKLNLLEGEQRWYMHGHLRILKEEGKLEKCSGNKGFK